MDQKTRPEPKVEPKPKPKSEVKPEPKYNLSIKEFGEFYRSREELRGIIAVEKEFDDKLTGTKLKIHVNGILSAGGALTSEQLDKVKASKQQRNQSISNAEAKSKIETSIKDVQVKVERSLGNDNHKPQMSPSEANQYTKGSITEGLTFYHGTTSEAAKNIAENGLDINRNQRGMYGNGFYLATAKAQGEIYASATIDPAVASFAVKIQNPLVLNDAKIAEIRKIQDEFTDVTDSGDKLWSDYAKANGHDSLFIPKLGYLIVLDKSQVVVKSVESVAKTDKKREENPDSETLTEMKARLKL